MLIEIVLNTLPHFPRQWFQLRQSKICRKLNHVIFKRLQYLFLSARKLQKKSKKSPMIKFWFKQFLMFCLTFPENGFKLVTQKLLKTEKYHFQTLRTFVFELRLASKPFSKKVPKTKFWFKQFLMLCFTFPTLLLKNL